MKSKARYRPTTPGVVVSFIERLGRKRSSDVSRIANRRGWLTLVALIAVVISLGFAFRVYAAIHSMGIVHPDEHQQYMEQANRLAYGYGVTFWEQDRGMRNYLYPGALAGFLRLFDACGLSDPVAQAAAIRFLLSSLSYLALLAVAWDYYGRGNRLAAGVFFVWISLSPVMSFLSVRTLSETAVIGPFFLALLFLSRRPVVAGLLLAVCFAVRFQTGILTATIFGLVMVEWVLSRQRERWAKLAWLLTGFSLGMFAIGGLDRLTFGSWFHSPIEYFRVDILENKAADFGVLPWEYYVALIVGAMRDFTVVGICLVIGAIKDWRLALVSLIFVAVHSAIGHKEPRFLYSLIPAAYLLAAVGLETAYRLLDHRRWRALLVASAICGAVGGEWLEHDSLQWNTEPFRSSALALAAIGKRPDVGGVGIIGGPSSMFGNYFYLRRNVPLVADSNRYAVLQARQDKPSINYVVAYDDLGAEVSDWKEINRVGIAVIYRLRDTEASRLTTAMDEIP